MKTNGFSRKVNWTPRKICKHHLSHLGCTAKMEMVRWGMLDPSVLTRNFEMVVRKAGYPTMRLHDLRHGHASGLIRVGAYPLVVQERLGHASAASTMQVYGHVSAGMQQEAANAFAGLMTRPKK